MAMLPPVLARLQMNTGDFDAKLEEAKAKIKSLGDTVHIKMDVDNSQLRQIAQDTEAMHRMMGRNATEGIRVEGFADAALKLEAIELKMDRLNGRTATVHVKTDTSQAGMLGSLLDKAGGAIGGFPSIGPLPGGPAGIAVIGAIGAGVAALLPELAGLVSGFAAAGAGAAAFGVLAAPAVKHVTSAYSTLNAAQKAYSQAQQKEQLDPSKANASALVKAADQLRLVREQIGKMPAAEQAAITGITNLTAAFSKQSKAFEPKLFPAFSSGLRLAATLLPTITPFANTFADSLSRIFTNLDKSAKGKGFQDFLKSFHGIEGPAVNAIAAGIGNVAGSVGRLLTVMSGKDVAHTLNIAFSGISGTIGAITSSVRFLMTTWDGMGIAIHNVASAFDGLRHGAAGIGHWVADQFDSMRHAVASFNPAAIIAKFAGLGPKIQAALSGAGGWLVSAGSAAIAGLWKGAVSYWGNVSGWFGGLGGKVKGFFAGAGGWLTSAGDAIMSGLLSGIESAWKRVASFLSSLAGKIKSLKGPLDYDRVMLYPHGQAIMQGLMGGMQSRVPALESQLRGITNSISQIAGNGHGAGGAGGGEVVHQVNVHLNGKVLYSEMQREAASTQRRTGATGLTKRTR